MHVTVFITGSRHAHHCGCCYKSRNSTFNVICGYHSPVNAQKNSLVEIFRCEHQRDQGKTCDNVQGEACHFSFYFAEHVFEHDFLL